MRRHVLSSKRKPNHCGIDGEQTLKSPLDKNDQLDRVPSTCGSSHPLNCRTSQQGTEI